MVEFRETNTSCYDGIVTRSYKDKTVSTEEAGKLLTELSERSTLLYEALDVLRTKSHSGDIPSDLVHEFVNFVVMYTFHRDDTGPGSAERYRKYLKKHGRLLVDTPFYHQICTKSEGTCSCTWCTEDY